MTSFLARGPVGKVNSPVSARIVHVVFLGALYSFGSVNVTRATNHAYVCVSPRDARYFELSDGRAFIPIGLNMIAPFGEDEGEALTRMDGWMRKLSANGGNFMRLWLSNPFFDVEYEQAGVYDEEKARRIAAVLEMARKYDIRVKMTLEHFRHLGDGRQSWAAKPIHHVSNGGCAETIVEFFADSACREQFRGKIAWYADRYGDDPVVFAWELWNEFDAVQELWKPDMWREDGGMAREWTQIMLAELHERFPRNLATQSQGSFDHERKVETYRSLCSIPNNDIAQVHRYLDLGAHLDVCHGPVDVLAADAVTVLLGFESGKPVLLAESGAVEPGHSGPFKLYDADEAGIILHDVLFAPFFAGAAGTGQCWHWDRYVARNDLWYHFGRFAEAVRGTDPPAERFRPIRIEHPRLRIYALAGQRTLLVWCRDKKNTWRTELAEGTPPERLTKQVVALPADLVPAGASRVRFYDPWTNAWSAGRLGRDALHLPAFRRSTVIRIGD